MQPPKVVWGEMKQCQEKSGVAGGVKMFLRGMNNLSRKVESSTRVASPVTPFYPKNIRSLHQISLVIRSYMLLEKVYMLVEL